MARQSQCPLLREHFLRGLKVFLFIMSHEFMRPKIPQTFFQRWPGQTPWTDCTIFGKWEVMGSALWCGGGGDTCFACHPPPPTRVLIQIHVLLNYFIPHGPPK